MNNREQLRERYCSQDVQQRLAGLAADLARVASSARHAEGAERVAEMLEESQYLIEWTAAETPVEVAAELVDIQVLLALWRRCWPDASKDPRQRSVLSVLAAHWANWVMESAGF
jgi:hypothetical protein